MPATGSAANAASAGSISANATVIAASTQLTVYIHHVARSSSPMRASVLPSKRPIATEIITDDSGTITSRVSVTAAMTAPSDPPHQSTSARNNSIESSSSIANRLMLNASL